MDLEFKGKILLVEGNNGTGKTSIIEALHYLCYLKSFRTRLTQEMIYHGSDSFFIKLVALDEFLIENQLQIGFSKEKRIIRLGDNKLTSHKDLINFLKVVSLTEDGI